MHMHYKVTRNSFSIASVHNTKCKKIYALDETNQTRMKCSSRTTITCINQGNSSTSSNFKQTRTTHLFMSTIYVQSMCIIFTIIHFNLGFSSRLPLQLTEPVPGSISYSLHPCASTSSAFPNFLI